MQFNSWMFAGLLATVWLLHRVLGRKQRSVLLLVASYVFYAAWDWRFVPLLLLLTGVAFSCGILMEHHRKSRKAYLILSLATCLGVLAFFKYCGFFVASTSELLRFLGLNVDKFTLSVVLPVGISFYTFQALAYTIDVYRGDAPATRDIVSFALFVSFFPQLVAGPIERIGHLLPQLQQSRRADLQDIAAAGRLLLTGYFKKVVIADGVAPLVDRIFDAPTAYGGAALLGGIYLFALQIYGDFSGYTDIARGAGRLFGIHLRENFSQPYLSTSITDFWQRWHMSLSAWLRDYLYIPLGGNRKGKWRAHANRLATMLLGGLWHGAGWTYIVWGGLHGLYIIAHRMVAGRIRLARPLGSSARRWRVFRLAEALVTFHMVGVAWVFFRSRSIGAACQYFRIMFSKAFSLQGGGAIWYVLVYGALVLGLDLLCFSTRAGSPFAARVPVVVRGGFYATAIALILFLGGNDARPFIYFQF